MNKSIPQVTQDDKQVSKSIKRFFSRFHVSSALRTSNAYKKKGIPVIELFRITLMDNTELSDDKVDELVKAFMDTISWVLKTRLQTA